jgi:cytosine/uracil/thiamine/allantoin permease
MVEMLCGSVIIKCMNKFKRYAGRCAVLVAAGVIVFGQSLASGAPKTGQAPIIKESLSWLVILYSLLALAGICVIAFKNPRRTQTR